MRGENFSLLSYIANRLFYSFGIAYAYTLPHTYPLGHYILPSPILTDIHKAAIYILSYKTKGKKAAYYRKEKHYVRYAYTLFFILKDGPRFMKFAQRFLPMHREDIEDKEGKREGMVG